MVTMALKTHNDDEKILFPDITGQLGAYVYESQKRFGMYSNSIDAAINFFNHNAYYNIHNVFHANRCFKKGPDCYAHLPDQPSIIPRLEFNKYPDNWYDWNGDIEKRTMFRFYS